MSDNLTNLANETNNIPPPSIIPDWVFIALWIFVGIFLIIGIYKKRNDYLYYALVIIAFCLLFSFINYPNYSQPISSWSSVILAFLAIISLIENYRLRKENQRIQNENIIRERHKEALERIRFWAEDTFTIMTKPLPNKKLISICFDIISEIQPYHIRCLGIIGDSQSINQQIHNNVSITYLSLTKFLFQLGATVYGHSGNFPDLLKKMVTNSELIDTEIIPFSNSNELILNRVDTQNNLASLINQATDLLVPSNTTK